MQERADIATSATSVQSRARLPRFWTPALAILAAAALVAFLLQRLGEVTFPATGVPGEVVVGPDWLKLPIAGLPQHGVGGMAREDISALWLGASLSIQSQFCSAVDAGGRAEETTVAGPVAIPGVYFVRCAASPSNPARRYWFRKTAHGVEACDDLTACKAGAASDEAAPKA